MQSAPRAADCALFVANETANINAGFFTTAKQGEWMVEALLQKIPQNTGGDIKGKEGLKRAGGMIKTQKGDWVWNGRTADVPPQPMVMKKEGGDYLLYPADFAGKETMRAGIRR